MATVGAFAAFSLMTIAIGTDYWLYSRAYICNATNASSDETQSQPKTKKGDLTHSGLWRICCIEGEFWPRAPMVNKHGHGSQLNTERSVFVASLHAADFRNPSFLRCVKTHEG